MMGSEETAKVICWVRTASDTRSTASSTAAATVPRSAAKSLAVDIDGHGNAGAGEYLTAFGLQDGERLAGGHGVTVVYASGAARTYRD